MSDTLTLVVIDQHGLRHEIPALAGWRVMEIIRDNMLPIKAECGGSCACATCHVYVDDAWLDKIPTAYAEEEDMLDTVDGLDMKRSRLSCQILMQPELDGMVVMLAPGSMPDAV